MPGGWKIGLWASKMTLGISKLGAKWVPGGQNRGLEAPNTSKIGSWTVWKAVCRARGSSGRHLGGAREGLDAILGPLGRPGRRFGGDFGGFGGPKRVRKGDFFGSKVETYKLAKSFVFQYVFNDFGGSGALEIDQNGVKWLLKSVRDGWWTQNMHLGG